MTKDFARVMGRLTSAPGFEELRHKTACRHWVDYLPFKEAHYQAIIAWLLSPQEGHGLGDYFLRRLLHAGISLPGRSVTDGPPGINGHELVALPGISFGAGLVTQELQFHDDQCRYVDIFVHDAFTSTAFLIERKDGSTENNNQLDAYYRWAERIANNNDLAVYPFYLDSGLSQTATRYDNGWFYLNDEWLTQAIDDLLEGQRLAYDQYDMFRTLANNLFGSWSEDRHPYYKGSVTQLANFAHAHREDLDHIREQTVGSGDQRIRDIAFNRLISELVLPETSDPWKQYATLAYANNYDLFSALLFTPGLDLAASEIQNRFPELEAVSWISPRHSVMDVIPKVDKPADQNVYWPIWLRVVRTLPTAEQVQKRDASEYRVNYSILIGASDTESSSVDSKTAREFANKAGLGDLHATKAKERYRTVCATLPDLDLSHDGVLLGWLEWLRTWRRGERLG